MTKPRQPTNEELKAKFLADKGVTKCPLGPAIEQPTNAYREFMARQAGGRRCGAISHGGRKTNVNANRNREMLDIICEIDRSKVRNNAETERP